MDIKTLENFNLGDAIFFHDELNKNLWDKNNQLRPEVKNQLLVIAKDFLEELGIKDLDVKDITVSGSNAAYTYTKHSDLDLHILVDMSKLPDDDVYRELFTAKKNLYNDSHDIKVHGVPVELYIQDTNEPVVSLGEYSILKDKWLRIPTKRRANFDQTITKQKYNKLLSIIERALTFKDLDKLNNIITTVKRYRKAGLDKGGEFGPENLAYKALRTQGYIDKLYQLRDNLHSRDLSIEEDNKLLDKPTMTPEQLARKHGVAKMHILQQLDMGIKVELEHTSGREVAREIALDHLGEDPNYYTKLQKAELEEKINPEVTKKEFHAEKDINIKDVGPLKLVAQNVADDYPQQFRIDVITPDGKKIGYFRFVVHDYEPEPKYKIFAKFSKRKDPYVLAGNVSVWSEYQKKGIATEVYKWVKSMGNDIRPSGTQTPAGKAMWRGFEKNQSIEETQEKKVTLNQLYNELPDHDEMIWNYIGDNDLDTPFTIETISPNKLKLYMLSQYRVEHIDEILDLMEPDQKEIVDQYSSDPKLSDQIIVMSNGKVVDGQHRAMASILSNKPIKYIDVSEENLYEASGYIPSEKEKNDPRFKTALTVDVKPDSIKKNAKAFNWKTSRAGIPPTLQASGKF